MPRCLPLLFVLVLGCRPDQGARDASGAADVVEPVDSASLDAGLQDGGPDASLRDSGFADTGSGDAGGGDAGGGDAGGGDTGVGDTGVGDTGVPDADPWVGTPCSVGGVPGVCDYVSACAGMSTPGLCPGPADVQCCTDPAVGGDCDPSDRPTPNVGLTEAPGAAGCPRGMVNLGAFCIDRYEAALVLIDASGTAIGSWSPFHNPGTNRVAAVSLRGAVPQGYISGRQAGTACEAAGKRLCSNTEWLQACQGSAGRTYPYGATRRPGVCNDARATHPAIERFGTSADWIWSELDDACINQIPDSLASTGDHPECVTPEGVQDLMGNLHEWTSDPSGTFRGGFYADTRINGEGCLYRTTAHSVGHFDYSTGFRCCASSD